MRPILVAVSGFSSEVGKTGLMCDLLRSHPGWEAIKVTRGHYRSCGKDPHACCVSHLLGDRPLVFSGRENTYKPEKDTGKYWDAGAGNVHWVVGTDQQIVDGVTTALSRVTNEGVFVEGTSFLKQIPADYSVMVARPQINDVKSSAVAVLSKVDALLITAQQNDAGITEQVLRNLERRGANHSNVPVYFLEDKPAICREIDRIVLSRRLV